MLSVCIWCAVQAGGEPGRSVNWGGAGVAGRARATAPPSKRAGDRIPWRWAGLHICSSLPSDSDPREATVQRRGLVILIPEKSTCNCNPHTKIASRSAQVRVTLWTHQNPEKPSRSCV